MPVGESFVVTDLLLYLQVGLGVEWAGHTSKWSGSYRTLSVGAIEIDTDGRVQPAVSAAKNCWVWWL